MLTEKEKEYFCYELVDLIAMRNKVDEIMGRHKLADVTRNRLVLFRISLRVAIDRLDKLVSIDDGK